MAKKGVIFIIFGVTGDLSKRKLIPAIYDLIRDKRLGDFHIIGMARREFSEKKLIASSKKYIRNPDSKILKKLEKNTTYVRGSFNDKKDYDKISLVIKVLEKKQEHNKIFYLATGSHNFENISKNLVETKVAEQHNCKTKVVYEKPFGRDAKSSKKLNKAIKRIFSEEQTYRIDHYLGKELVGTVSILRFTNRILEPIWNRKHIDNIQIILDENFGIDERGPYYDTYGSVRDMCQNHMLQLLALLTMEKPKFLTGEYVRSKKAKLLKRVVIKDSLLGQYEGYTSEKGIPKNSQTDTFAAMRLEINNRRWRGVPIFFRTGKFLSKKETKIVVNFKKAKCLFNHECKTQANSLEIKIFPHEGITLNLNTKAPRKNDTKRIKMDFCYSCEFGPNTPEGYENLFFDIINGDQTVFTRIDELQNAWKVVDKIKRTKPFIYKIGSDGPKEMEDFNKRNGVVWS